MAYKIVEFDDTFPEHNSLTEEDVLEWLDNQKWKFSSNYAKKGLPHSYLLEKNFRKDRKKYYSVVAYLLKYGLREKFFRVEFIYFYYNDHKYFIASTKDSRYGVINKAPIKK